MNIQALDGQWKIVRDEENHGARLDWQLSIPPEAADAPVPGIIQEVFPFYDGVAWYYTRFNPRVESSGRVLLRFGSVDYFAEVWLNGAPLGKHEDGEEPFVFDVTDFIAWNRENLLAVRVICPCETAIDGFVLNETPHCNKFNLNYTPGNKQNAGGIIGSVTLESVPRAYMTDVYVRPDYTTGEVRVEIETMNAGSAACATFAASVFENAGGAHVATIRKGVQMSPGKGRMRLDFSLPERRNWSFEEPFLYVLRVSIGDAKQAHEKSVRFGFRELRVQNGFFMLNGKRIWLKCSHTGNCFPIGSLVPRNPDLLYRDLVFAKAMGFNAVRFISSLPLPVQLDYCDELGLMVYEEPYAAWLLAEGPHMAQRYDRSALNMVRRDRNHACVTIFGLLNETCKTSVYEHAKGFLPRLRALDDTRLVLLSSGRFDGETSVGSLSNSGSDRWEFEWGKENPDSDRVGVFGDNTDFPGPYMEQMGDIHVYPQVPQSARDTMFLRTVGQNSKPIFVSEYGIGSQPNFIQEYRKFEEAGRTDTEDASIYRSMLEHLEADWARYALGDCFCFPEDFLIESIRANARQRQQTFDCLRANPMVCGFNVTGLLDHASCGEGFWTLWREFKPGLADAVREGFAPLRWAIFANRCAYSQTPVHIEAILSNEDVLAPGRYRAMLRIRGKSGIVWERALDAVLPKSGYGGLPPLAVPVFDEWISFDEPGDYEIGVSLLEGGAALGGRAKISVLAAPKRIGEGPLVAYSVGLNPYTEQWLSDRGVMLTSTYRAKFCAPILIGREVQPGEWRTIYELVAAGCSAIFLRPEVFASREHFAAVLPLDNPGNCLYYRGWLYHLDNVFKAHPVFAGLGTPGLLESEYFGPVYPKYMFEGIQAPELALCVALGGGQMRPSGYASGLTLGEFRFGRGKIILSCFEIEQNLGAHPTADLLLANLLTAYHCKGALDAPDPAVLSRLDSLPTA